MFLAVAMIFRVDLTIWSEKRKAQEKKSLAMLELSTLENKNTTSMVSIQEWASQSWWHLREDKR